MQAVCEVCFHHCKLKEGQYGICRARKNEGGRVVPANYGKLTAIQLDPIEKKPLARFYPGSYILSVGSYGCNLFCPFCQNSEISRAYENENNPDSVLYGDTIKKRRISTETMTPEELCELACHYKDLYDNLGVAFTYNEPLCGWEYIRDTAVLLHEAGLKTVLVSNGTVSREVEKQLISHIDAMNIDLKGFTERFYSEVLKGSLSMTKDFIAYAAGKCHLELTTLIIPGENDSDEEMDALSSWVASLPDGQNIPLHVSRFFPRYHMTDRGPTPVSKVYHLAEVARKHLKYVYTGNC